MNSDPDILNLMDKVEELAQTDINKLAKNSVLANTIVTQVKPGTILSDDVKTLVTDLNANFFLFGEYPTLAKLTEKFPFLTEYGGEQLEELFEQVNDVLENARDLPPFQVKFKTVRTLDPIFVAACNLIADIGDKRPLNAKLKAVGLTTGKFRALLRIKLHQDYYSALIDNLMDYDAWQEGRLALARNVASGDLPSIKYFNELTNKFTEKKDFDPRIITHFMTAILEIVASNVDAQTARKIADELEVVAVKQLGVIDV